MRGDAYLYQREDWPDFRYDARALLAPLADVTQRRGLLIGRLETLGFGELQDAKLAAISQEVLKTSEIEGERFDPRAARSSIAWHLGVPTGGVPSGDHRLEGIVLMALDATERWDEPLDEERLFRWHAGLFPEGSNAHGPIGVGRWRDDAHGPMQIVSGPIGRFRVHYEAPGAARLPAEMARFLRWFESDAEPNGILKAGIAHLWFEIVHPFDDGNGRVGRAILDLALARSDRREWRCYSVSGGIMEERKAYYDALQSAQAGALDVTEWLLWYLGVLGRALDRAADAVAGALARGRFWHEHAEHDLNERQRRVLNRMLHGFEGKMTRKKWAKIGRCSPVTAVRDLNEMVALGILLREGEGRGTAYRLVEEKAGGVETIA